MRIRTLDDLKTVQQKGLKKLLPPDRPRIAVGLATCGIAAGGDGVYAAIQDALKEKNVDAFLTKTGCFGICNEEPLVNIRIPGKPLVILHKVKKDDADLIVNKVTNMDVPEDKALCKIEEWDHLTLDKPLQYGKGYNNIPLWNEIPYFKPQKKVVLRDAGIINPEDIEEYIAIGGYSALYKALVELTPDEVIEEVKKSGLRGRGGAGFPTGMKWGFTKKEKNPIKYVICNADEGDPGAYMNRNEMESDPHMIIEGMIIGAYAIGAKEGYIYVRAEYPLAIERLKKAIEQAEKYGLLGENIFGSNFSFNIKLATGAVAFVCGEETALIASIEGKPGRPRPRPPFPAQKGLWDKPTNINNVETWCNIPPIIKKGGEWFSKIGTKRNSGTKVFSLVGKIN
ncbi:MAG: NADH-quinone oxidoreductase subunit J/K, partial [Nitrospiraceae bacterium]|nr:NADH-quinone oxidoreductase subunit J/K [Nitrospiraceae bacterium]